MNAHLSIYLSVHFKHLWSLSGLRRTREQRVTASADRLVVSAHFISRTMITVMFTVFLSRIGAFLTSLLTFGHQQILKIHPPQGPAVMSSHAASTATSRVIWVCGCRSNTFHLQVEEKLLYWILEWGLWGGRYSTSIPSCAANHCLTRCKW